MASDRSGRVWEEVRRALGRLVGNVSIHSLEEARSGISAEIRRSVATEFAALETGRREGEAQVPATVRELTPPVAAAGGEGADLAAVLTVIGANQALASREPTVLTESCAFGCGHILSWRVGQDGPLIPRVRAETVHFGAGAVSTPAVRWEAPTVHRLSSLGIIPPKKGRGPDLAWKLPSVRTRNSLEAVLRVPLTCGRLDPGVAGLQALVPERRLLATATGTPETDVALIGVFPHVPLGAVQKLAMSQDGRGLEIWLKPSALGRTTPHNTVTVVLGRQRSTGRVLQTVRLPGAGAAL